MLLARSHALFLFVLLCAPARAEVWIVAADGSGDFLEIQAAVTASLSGDVIVVREGQYGPVRIADQGLAVVAHPHDDVRTEEVEVSGVPPGATVLLDRIEVRAVMGPGLWVTDSKGSVRVQACTFLGADGVGSHGSGGDPDDPAHGRPGVRADRCDDLSLVDCELRGGRDSGISGYFGADGGSGIQAASSRIALYWTGAHGGWGRDALSLDAGDGGPGGQFEDSTLLAVASTFRGGRGATTIEDCGDPGDGGHGL